MSRRQHFPTTTSPIFQCILYCIFAPRSFFPTSFTMADDTSEEGLLDAIATKQEIDTGVNGVNDGYSEVSKSSENLDSLTEETNLLPGSSQETIPVTSQLERTEIQRDVSNSGEGIWLAMDSVQYAREEEREKSTEAVKKMEGNELLPGPGARPKQTQPQVTIGGREVKFIDTFTTSDGEVDAAGNDTTKDENESGNGRHHGAETSKDQQQVTNGNSLVTVVESKTPYVDIPSDFDDQLSHSSSVAGSLPKGVTPSSVFIGMEECRTLPNLPKRPPLLLEFKGLSYSVKEGSFWHKNRGKLHFKLAF